MTAANQKLLDEFLKSMNEYLKNTFSGRYYLTGAPVLSRGDKTLFMLKDTQSGAAANYTCKWFCLKTKSGGRIYPPEVVKFINDFILNNE